MGNEELFVVDKIDGNRDNIPTNKVSKIYICYSNIVLTNQNFSRNLKLQQYQNCFVKVTRLLKSKLLFILNKKIKNSYS